MLHLILLAVINQLNPNRQIQQPIVNSAIFETYDVEHSGPNRCLPSGGVMTYTCSFGSINKALLTYTRGMEILLLPDVDCPGGCTVNIDNNGIKSVKQSDGTTDKALIHGHGYRLFFDGTVFRDEN